MWCHSFSLKIDGAVWCFALGMLENREKSPKNVVFRPEQLEFDRELLIWIVLPSTCVCSLNMQAMPVELGKV